MVGVALLLAAVLAQDADREAEEAVARFAREMNAADAAQDDRVAAIRIVGKVKHKRVLEALTPYLTADTVPQRIATVRALGCFDKVPGTLKALTDAYVNEANRTEQALAVRISLVKVFGAMKAAPAVELVNRAIEDQSLWLVKAGCDAAAKIRHKSSVEPLLRQLYRIEGNEGNKMVDEKDPLADPLEDLKGMQKDVKGRARKYGEPAAVPSDQTEREILRAPLVGALKSITRQGWATYGEWWRWWINARRRFEVPR